MTRCVEVANSLTSLQRRELSEKLKILMGKFSPSDSGALEQYFSGVQDGLHHAYSLVNEIDGGYNTKP